MSEHLTHARQFIDLTRLAARLANLASEGESDWETIYHLVFSADVSGQIKATGIEFDWCDPDTSYEDDVRAYVAGITEKARKLERIFGLLD